MVCYLTLHLTVTQVCAALPDHLHDPRDRFRTASVGKDRRELFRDLDLAADGWRCQSSGLRMDRLRER